MTPMTDPSGPSHVKIRHLLTCSLMATVYDIDHILTGLSSTASIQTEPSLEPVIPEPTLRAELVTQPLHRAVVHPARLPGLQRPGWRQYILAPGCTGLSRSED